MKANPVTVAMIPIATLLALPPEQLDAMAKSASKALQDAKTANEENRTQNPTVGKVICALDVRRIKAIDAKLLAPNTSLAGFWKTIAGGAMPTHAMSCAVAFGTFVSTELIDEPTYDLNSSNALQLAGQISNEVGGDVNHPAIRQCVDELKERSKYQKQNLRVILASVKKREPMDAEDAAKRLGQIFADGHLHLTIASVAAQIVYLKNHTSSADAYMHLLTAGETVDAALGAEKVNWCLDQFNAKKASEARAKAPVSIVAGHRTEAELQQEAA